MSDALDILVVDDDAQKLSSIRALLDKCGANINAVQHAANASAAVQLLRSTAFDLMVLDMQLPFREGEEPRPDGGARIIEALKQNGGLLLPSHIVGLTQYDNLLDRFRADLERDLWSLIKYEASSVAWEEQLRRYVEHIVDAKRQRRDVRYKSSVAIVTALHEVELEAVLEVWPELTPHRENGDAAVYHRGTISCAGVEHAIVAVAATQMGMAASTALSMKVIDTFRPRYLCMCGIAAGAKGEFGDILVATQSWDYGSGKQTALLPNAGVFHPAPERIPLSESLKYQLEWFRMRTKEFGEGILESWRVRNGTPQPSKPPTLRPGPIASGAAVVANRGVIDRLLEMEDRKLVGIEMESYGMVLATRHCREPRPDALVAKSICDFGDTNKDDRYQRYAAYTSAAAVRRFFEGHLLPLERRHGV